MWLCAVHVTACGTMWLCAVRCGSLWSHVASCGPWSHVAARGPLRLRTRLSATRPLLKAPPFWPIQGHVAFRQVRLCYRAGLPYALRDVCFETRPAEKVGIVGRTGSGKSSLFRTLFRIVEIEAGQILVDGINISHLPLDQLRWVAAGGVRAEGGGVRLRWELIMFFNYRILIKFLFFFLQLNTLNSR